MQEDQRLRHLKINYLEADFKQRAGIITVREFNKVLVDTLIGLLDAFDEVEPYYEQFKLEADKNWKEALAVNPKNPKPPKTLKGDLKEMPIQKMFGKALDEYIDNTLK